LNLFSILKWKNFLKNSKFLFFVVLLLWNQSFYCQQIREAKDVVGQALISGDVSPNLAKQQALNEAKVNALKAAGIGEQINSYQLLLTSQQKNDYSQFFSSDIQTEMQGAIQSFVIKNERIFSKNEFEMVCEVTIDAQVIKYDVKPDTGFDAEIEEIKGVYNNDDKLRFALKTTQSCYLTIFDITDKEAFVLFPNAYEKQLTIKPFEYLRFPIAPIDYTLHTDLKDKETNRLIFVFTKTPIPFIKMDVNQLTTSENIFSWIFSIMPDQRKIEYKTILIQK
jgi:hypothetical protein